jgi:uncharacterized membrane protein required for colicin V production
MVLPLDLLIAVILLLFLAIGSWRGLLREAIATVGILLAAMLANQWALPWGAALTTGTGLTRPLASFLVAILLFLGVVFVIGYGSALLLPTRPPTRWQRLVGGLIGLVNGALVTGYTLGFLQTYLLSSPPDSFIMQSAAGWFLVNLVAFIFLLPVLVLTPAILVMAVVRFFRWLRGGAARQQPTVSPAPGAAAPIVDEPPTRALPRPTETLETTQPLATSPVAAPAESAPPPAASVADTQPAATTSPGRDEPSPATDDSGPTRPCPTCGREIAADARFCRHCGRTL